MTPRFFHEPGPGLGFVDLTVAFDVGAEADPPGREGLARLAARLVRCGTPGRTRAQVDAEVERLGARLEAAAGQNTVMLRARVIRENLEPLAALLVELVLRPAMREEDFDQARALHLAELVQVRDQDRDLAGRAFRRALYPDGPVGRPASGTVASVRRLALEDCVRFHRDLCARDTLLVGVAGDATETEARRALLDRLEALPERAAVARPAWPDAAPPRGRRALLVDKPDRSQAQIYLGHFGPKPGRDHHDGLYVSTVAFGGTLSARLMQEIRVKRGWSYGAYAQLARSRRDDAFYLWTFPKSADLGPCLALELDLLRAVAQDGVAPQELELARGYLVGSSVFLVDTPADRLERRIEVETLGFPPDYYAAFRRRVESVTLESARAATAACVHPDDLVVAVLCTAAQARDAVRKALGDGAAVDVVAFDDDTL